eukprot:TRINITY_DN12223_c0_g1_i1.p1 TRINITY_DN12223_c0_g1~~TRINITY_DN12223_c0_g1_i1.p1  ORF type:complete len:202 (-),score=12.38 TRINITY_DN12223_c0_g1_i1:107-712(-)
MTHFFGAFAGHDKKLLASSITNNAPKKLAEKMQEVVNALPDHDAKSGGKWGEGVYFHIEIQNRFFFCCFSDQEEPRVPYTFLHELKENFFKKYSAEGSTYPDEEKLGKNCSEFNPAIGRQLKFYNENPDADMISKVSQQIKDVTAAMITNIDDLMKRGERLEELEAKSQEVLAQSKTMKAGARKVKESQRCCGCCPCRRIC